MVTNFTEYKSHIIYNGKTKLKGLPATFADENKAQTLEITCVDEYCGIEVVLIYSVIENYSSVIRSARIKNNSINPINITRAMSMALQRDSDKYDMHTFYGSWARERHLERSKLHHGKQSIDSLRGESSHQHNPFFYLKRLSIQPNFTFFYFSIFCFSMFHKNYIPYFRFFEVS